MLCTIVNITYTYQFFILKYKEICALIINYNFFNYTIIRKDTTRDFGRIS